MSLSPLSSPALGAADASKEVLAASLAKKQQNMEGAQALSLIQNAAKPPPPSGASGGHINVMV